MNTAEIHHDMKQVEDQQLGDSVILNQCRAKNKQNIPQQPEDATMGETPSGPDGSLGII